MQMTIGETWLLVLDDAVAAAVAVGTVRPMARGAAVYALAILLPFLSILPPLPLLLSLLPPVIRLFLATLDESMPLERVLARELLVAVGAGEGLDGEMDALMALEVMVAAECLGTLVTPKGSLCSGLLRRAMAAVHVGRRLHLLHVRASLNHGHVALWVVKAREGPWWWHVVHVGRPIILRRGHYRIPPRGDGVAGA